jgi:hypothetical protein
MTEEWLYFAQRDRALARCVATLSVVVAVVMMVVMPFVQRAVPAVGSALRLERPRDVMDMAAEP